MPQKEHRGLLALGDRNHCEAIYAAMQHGTLLGPIMANAGGGNGDRRGMHAVINDIASSIEGFKAEHTNRLGKIEADMNRFQEFADDMACKIAAQQIGAGQRGTTVPDPNYSKIFASFIRSGDHEHELRNANRSGDRANIQASWNSSSGADGGYLSPVEWDRQITAAQIPLSPMRRLANVITTGVAAFSTVWNARGIGSGWVGETAARPETTTPTLGSLTFSAGEIYAFPFVTQRLLEDASVDVGQFISDQIAEEFATQESLAFVAGNGINKPSGFLTYAVGGTHAATHPGGALDTVTVAGTTAVTFDELISFFYGLASPYRQNASWLMNSTTVATISKLKDAAGNYIWQPAIAEGQPATLLGRPVETDENMPSMVAGALPIALGDFRKGYLINDRLGVSILRDQLTNKPFVGFYARKRVGGGVMDPEAIRVIKQAAS